MPRTWPSMRRRRFELVLARGVPRVGGVSMAMRRLSPAGYSRIRVLTRRDVENPACAHTGQGYSCVERAASFRSARERTMTMSQTADQLTYSVPGMSCGHCRAAITAEVEKVEGIASVDV